MPNWCYNHYSLEGKAIDILNLYEGMKGKRAIFADNDTNGKDNPDEIVYTFNAIAPIADEYLKFPYSDSSKYSSREITDGYKACIYTWGTKWDVLEEATDYINLDIKKLNTLDPNDVTCCGFSIETAWSPAEDFNLALSKKNPNVKITVYSEEGGCDIYQEIIYENGEIFESKTWDSKLEVSLSDGEDIEELVAQVVDNEFYEIDDGDTEAVKDLYESVYEIFKKCSDYISKEDMDKLPDLIKCEINEYVENECRLV